MDNDKTTNNAQPGDMVECLTNEEDETLVVGKQYCIFNPPEDKEHIWVGRGDLNDPNIGGRYYRATSFKVVSPTTQLQTNSGDSHPKPDQLIKKIQERIRKREQADYFDFGRRDELEWVLQQIRGVE